MRRRQEPSSVRCSWEDRFGARLFGVGFDEIRLRFLPRRSRNRLIIQVSRGRRSARSGSSGVIWS